MTLLQVMSVKQYAYSLASAGLSNWGCHLLYRRGFKGKQYSHRLEEVIVVF